MLLPVDILFAKCLANKVIHDYDDDIDVVCDMWLYI